MVLKVLQWNILFSDSLEKMDEIIDEIKRFNADVYCLQEVSEIYNSNIIDKLLKVLPYSAFSYADEKRFENRIQGNAIISRYPLINTSDVLISPRHDYEQNIKREGRSYLECEVVVNNKNFTLATTHLSLKKPNRSRHEEENILLKLLNKHNKNYIFTGDLNSIPSDSFIEKVKDILKHCGPNENEKTCTTKPRLLKDGTTEPYLGLRIDYIFASRELKVKSAKILKIELSDHLPIMVEFEL